MSTLNIIGWSILTLSWIVYALPEFLISDLNKPKVGLVLSSIALVIFIFEGFSHI